MPFLSVSKCRIKVWHSLTASIKSLKFYNIAMIGTTGCEMWLQTTSGKIKSNRKRADKWTPDLSSPFVCKYSWTLTMTGNVHLKVDSSFASPPRFTQVFSLLFPSNMPFTASFLHVSCSNLSFFRRVVEDECDLLPSSHQLKKIIQSLHALTIFIAFHH
jgi:hypothetical protein